MYTPEDKGQTKFFGAYLADINYYNQYHKIVRVKFQSDPSKPERLFDFKYLGGAEVPNPKRHIAIIVTNDESISETKALKEERLSFLPGLLDENGNLADLPMGFVYVVPTSQSSGTTVSNSGGAAFTIEKFNTIDIEKMAIAISPPTNIDYTSKENTHNEQEVNEGKPDLKDKNVGLFINNDGTVLLKSTGGMIALGEEGVYVAGPVAWESSEHQREWLMDNFLQRFIPSTIPTGALAIPELPNIAKFAQIAEGFRKVTKLFR
jgi:hypothetical protein